MSVKTTGFWIVAVIAAAALGWYAAMEVNRGPAFADEADAYERFSNALTVTDTMGRIEVLSRLTRRLTPETLPGATRAFKDIAADVYNVDLRMLTWYWGQQDPRGMLAEMQSWTQMRARRVAAAEAVYWVLKKEGYDSARALFDQIPEKQRESALPSLILAYLESGQQANLIQLIDAYQTREERDLAAAVVVQHMLRLNEPEDVIKWVESLPDGPGSKSDVKPVAFRAAVNQLMLRNRIDVMDGWLGRIDGQPWANGGRRAVGVNLARREPKKAIDWAKALTPEQGRDEILAEVLRTFAYEDREGALEWIRAQEPQPALDVGTARLAYEYAHVDPQTSLEMVLRVQDPEVFANIRRTVTFAWTDLPEEQRNGLMAKLEAYAKTLTPASKPAVKSADSSR